MQPETVRLYHTRLEEDYDLADDELYSIWKKLHSLSLSDPPAKESNEKSVDHPTVPEKEQQLVSSALDEVLTYLRPKDTSRSKKGKSTSTLPKHLSGDQFIQYMQQKEDAKLAVEAEKKRKQEEQKKKRKRSGKSSQVTGKRTKKGSEGEREGSEVA